MQQEDSESQLRRELHASFIDKSCHNNILSPQKEIEYYTQKIKEIEKLTFESKRFFALLDHSTYFPVYISKNFESESGYSLQQIKEERALLLFKKLHLAQINMPHEVFHFGKQMHEKFGSLYKPNGLKIKLCGIKLKDKWGKWRTMIFSQKVLTFTKNNNPILSYLEAEEISAYHQSDSWWYRIEITTATFPVTRVLFSDSQKKETCSLLSKRELQILKLSAEKKTNSEIADQLGITKNTVERHRKNMLAKTGLMNMSGLLRIAQILNLV